MSRHSTDPKFSPLLMLVPLPFVLATCLPLDLDRSRAAPKVQRVAAATTSHDTVERAASAATIAATPSRQHLSR